jgi:hypothetical protein
VLLEGDLVPSEYLQSRTISAFDTGANPFLLTCRCTLVYMSSSPASDRKMLRRMRAPKGEVSIWGSVFLLQVDVRS